MPQTSIYGFPYLGMDDPPDIPKTGKDLGDRMEAVLQADLTLGGALTVPGALTVSGAVSLGNPRAKVYRNGAFSIVHNTWALLAWDAQVWTSAGMHDTGTNPSRLIAPTTGKYTFAGAVSILNQVSVAGGNDRAVNIRKNAGGNQANGTDLLLEMLPATGTASNPASWTTLSWNVDVALNAGEYVEAFWRHQQGGGITLNGITGEARTYAQFKKIIE